MLLAKSPFLRLFAIATFLIYNVSCKSKNVVNSGLDIQVSLDKYFSVDTTLKYTLDSILNFDWDEIIILTPYFDRKKVEACSGISILESILESTEGPNEYIFIKDKKVAKYISSKELERIILSIDKSAYVSNKDAVKCGIKNSANLYIKLMPNENPYWKGKTFLIFNK